MKSSELVLDYVHLLYQRCHKINQYFGGSDIDSPDWTKNKNAAIKLISKKDDKYFQYAVTVALNHEKTKNDPQKNNKN